MGGCLYLSKTKLLRSCLDVDTVVLQPFLAMFALQFVLAASVALVAGALPCADDKSCQTLTHTLSLSLSLPLSPPPSLSPSLSRCVCVYESCMCFMIINFGIILHVLPEVLKVLSLYRSAYVGLAVCVRKRIQSFNCRRSVSARSVKGGGRSSRF